MRSMLIHYTPRVSFLDSRSHKPERELKLISKLLVIFQNLEYFAQKFVFLISQKEMKILPYLPNLPYGNK